MKRITTTLCLCMATLGGASAQPRFTSNAETLSLGQVRWKHPLTVHYTVTNTGDRPLLLADVEPDCACTAADWTRTPIAPGGKGTVSVTFDAEALGTFRKSVAVRTNAEPRIVRLNFHGEVVREIRDYAATHPYLIGRIRIDRNAVDFPDVHPGDRPEVSISVANLSDGPYEPVLMHLPPYLDMNAEPAVLRKGETGALTLTLNPDRLPGLGLTQASVYLSRFAGDKVADESEIPVTAILLPDFSDMTETQRRNAPAVQLSDTVVGLGKASAGRRKAACDIAVGNTGRSPLHIGKLQVFHPAVGVSLKKAVIAPGESVRLRVTVDRRRIGGTQHRHLRLLMITDDPARPKVEIDIKPE